MPKFKSGDYVWNKWSNKLEWYQILKIVDHKYLYKYKDIQQIYELPHELMEGVYRKLSLEELAELL
jgi:hypothetical protein